jgi:hypothetical protein
MGLDIRLPIGLLFSVVGIMLTIYGAITRNSLIYEKSLGIDINLIWGVALLAFGVFMLLLGWHKGSKASSNVGASEAQPPRGH